MAGLLQQQGMAPQGGQPNPQAQPGQPQQPAPQGRQQGGDPRVDMDPQQGTQQRDQLVSAMLESLYGPMLGQVQQMLEQQRDQPEQAIGRIVSQLMLTTYQALADQGSTVPPGVMVQAGMIAAQAVGEMAIQVGALDAEDGDTIEAGFMLAMAQFGQAAGQDMPPEQRKRYADLLAGLREAKGGGQPQAQPPGSPQPPQGAPQQPMQGGM